TSRDMGADAPTFSITLTRRKDWHKWVGSNDLVAIMMRRPPESMATVFIGLVDDCRKSVAISGDSVERVTTVTGRGLAKAFVQFDIGAVPEADYSDPSMGWLASRDIILGGSTS